VPRDGSEKDIRSCTVEKETETGKTGVEESKNGSGMSKEDRRGYSGGSGTQSSAEEEFEGVITKNKHPAGDKIAGKTGF